MNLKKVVAVIFLFAGSAFPADQQWALDQSTLTYHVSHPLHQTDGVSHAARGKGVCHAGACDFLIAVPVKSFDSGDSNRDLHMLQVTRGAEFPMVTVRTQLPEAAEGSTKVDADLEIQCTTSRWRCRWKPTATRFTSRAQSPPRSPISRSILPPC